MDGDNLNRNGAARGKARAPIPNDDRGKQIADFLQQGVDAHRVGDLDKAERLYRLVLRREPNHAIALNDLGILLLQRGQRAAGEEFVRKAVAAKPDYAEAQANLGKLLRETGDFESAIAAFEQAVAAKPEYAEGHFDLGLAFEKKNDTDAALAAFERAIVIRPAYPEAQFGRANALKAKGRNEEAIAAYRAAIALKPDYAAAHARLGIVLAQTGEIEDAIAAYRQALDLKPQNAEVASNLALALVDTGETDAAIAEYRRALALAPDWAHAHFGLSLALLAKGDHSEGWREYEWRWKGAIEKLKPRELPKPQWQGEELSGKTLLVYAEQGFGDTLQFVRFVPGLAARGGRVVVEAQGKLVSLLRMSGVAETVIPAGAALPEFDYHVPLLSVPPIIGLAEATIPLDIPYLFAEPGMVARWRQELGTEPGLKVGIVWAGNPVHKNDHNRSVALERLQPLLDIPGLRWFSLQVGDRTADLARIPAGTIRDLSPKLTDFAETAAAIANLDLVVTVDTSVAHVAGALGQPVWMMLPFSPDWRWLQHREDTPWYPCTRLFRQSRRGDWDELITRVAAELAEVAAGRTERLFAHGKLPPADERADRARVAFDQGFRLHRDGKLQQAAAAYSKAITLDPNHGEAYSNLGVIRQGARQIDDAINFYRRAIAIKPDHVAALGNLAVALTAKGDLDGAIAALQQAIGVKPDYADGHLRLGDLLRRKGDVDGAIEAYRQATLVKPDDPTAQFNLAFGLQTTGAVDSAIQGYRRALALDPNQAQAHANLGVALVDSGRIAEGIGECRQALALQPNNPKYHSNLGLALSKADQFDAALEHYRRAVALDPNYAEAYVNLALALLEIGAVDEAIAAGRKAILLKPDYAEAHFNLSLALLLKGEFADGWQEYEWRWKGGVKKMTPQKFARPQWRGEDLAGKTLLLHAEQGLGDMLQFARFAPVLSARGARVVLAVPRELKALLRSITAVEAVVGTGEKLPLYDFHLPLMSVPAILGTNEGTLPATVPYLAADPQRIARWRARLPSSGFKVGIAWQGRPDASIDKGRSIPLRAFEPLAAVTGVRLISLQKNHGLEQLDLLPHDMRIETLGADFDEGPDAFLDAAAVIEDLDLVITSDTSIAHLAGALGRPVWVALKSNPDWRWLLDRDDSPWYPTARLFRQRSRGDWGTLFQSIAQELAGLVARHAALHPLKPPSGAAAVAPEMAHAAAPIMVPIAMGELVDKITILEIKAERITDAAKLLNVRSELDQLRAIWDRRSSDPAALAALVAQLKRANEKLWLIEDEIRGCERQNDFGAQFIALARSIYRTNDHRAEIKREINRLAGSTISEEKSYSPY